MIKRKQFFLFIVPLTATEIRMQLEDRNVDLIVACLISLEICVSFIALDTIDLDQKEKQQIYTAPKDASSAVELNLIEIFKI
ncbi:hypothetical protein PGB90_004328 [Kerria lacca]